MRYSLLSRFEGGLLGGAIAAVKLQGQDGASSIADARELQDSAIASLLRCGRFDTSDWLGAIATSSPTLLQRREKMTTSEVAIAIFPLALSSHEHRDSLHARVRTAADVWLHDGDNLTELLLWADAIALILREKLPPNDLLDRLLALALIPAEDLKTLEYLPLHLESATPLETLARAPETPSPLAIALYCFAATPEAFSLCLDRALRSPAIPPLTALLVGTLAGLYNSSSGLPARSGLHPSQRQHVQQQARQLFAAWSGTYRLERWEKDAPVVAGAGMLQPRPFLEIISHEPTS